MEILVSYLEFVDSFRLVIVLRGLCVPPLLKPVWRFVVKYFVLCGVHMFLGGNFLFTLQFDSLLRFIVLMLDLELIRWSVLPLKLFRLSHGPA